MITHLVKFNNLFPSTALDHIKDLMDFPSLNLEND
jgi:hypothetical protein